MAHRRCRGVFGRAFVFYAMGALAFGVGHARADEAYADILSFDHTVDTVSQSPALKGIPIKLFVRERIQDKVLKAGRASTANGKAVLFVHGGTYPSVPDFDLPFKDYSWMAFLAEAGFDVYSVDMTGYGKSSRPHMENPCNVAADQQSLIGQKPCASNFTEAETTTQSDWADVDAAVDFVRKQTGAAKINLVGWSGGGPRVGGYTALHGDKVARVVFLAPGYNRSAPDVAPAPKPDQNAPTLIATREMAMARWDAAVKCQDQYDPAIRDVIWNTNLAFDPVGAKWGPGVVRHPRISSAGWNAKLSPKFNVPVLMLAGELDIEVKPEAVRNLYDDISSTDKVLINLECGSHYVVYERGYKVLLEASKEWFLTGKYHGSAKAVMHADRTGKITDTQ